MLDGVVTVTDDNPADLTIRQRAERAASGLPVSSKETQELAAELLRWLPVIEAACRWKAERGPKQSGPLTAELERAIDAAREKGRGG